MATLTADEGDAPLVEIAMIGLNDDNSDSQCFSDLQLDEYKVTEEEMKAFLKTERDECNLIQTQLNSSIDDSDEQQHLLKKTKWIHRLAQLNIMQQLLKNSDKIPKDVKHGADELFKFNLALHNCLTEQNTAINILKATKTFKGDSSQHVLLSDALKECIQTDFGKNGNEKAKSALAEIVVCNHVGEVYEMMLENMKSMSKTFYNHTCRWKQQARYICDIST